MEPVTPFIIRNIQWFIDTSGMSNREFARQVGVTGPTVDLWYKGVNVPKPSYHKLIASVMKRSVYDLTRTDIGKHDMFNQKTTEPEQTIPAGNVIYVDVPVSGGALDGDYYKDAETSLLTIPGWTGEGYAFTVHGDSMAPRITEGDIVVCKPMTGVNFAPGTVYMIQTHLHGMTCKYVKLLDQNTIELSGENKSFARYTLPTKDVKAFFEVRGVYKPMR